MIEKIRRKIALFSIRRLFSSSEKNAIPFKGFFSDSNTILISIPSLSGGKKNLFSTLEELHKEGKKITLLLNESQLDQIKSKSNYSFLLYKSDDLNRLKLPGNELIKKIKSKKYDLFIDLDLNESLLNYAVAGICNAQFRLGFSKIDADKFYNFQVPIVERNYEISYRNLLNSIRMF